MLQILEVLQCHDWSLRCYRLLIQSLTLLGNVRVQFLHELRIEQDQGVSVLALGGVGLELVID
jgi:hypothetical protein